MAFSKLYGPGLLSALVAAAAGMAEPACAYILEEEKQETAPTSSASTTYRSLRVYANPVQDASLIPVHFFAICADSTMKTCVGPEGAFDAAGVMSVEAFRAQVEIMNRRLNWDGGLANYVRLRRGYSLGTITKVYAPQYLDITSTSSTLKLPSNDGVMPAFADSVNIYVVRSAPFCGTTRTNTNWKSSRGVAITVNDGCTYAAKADWLQANGSYALQVNGDTAITHELMHTMGVSHTADYSGGTASYSACGRSYRWLVRKLDPAFTGFTAPNRNIMSYDSRAWYFAPRDPLFPTKVRYETLSSFGFESLRDPLFSTQFSAGDVMRAARDCTLSR